MVSSDHTDSASIEELRLLVRNCLSKIANLESSVLLLKTENAEFKKENTRLKKENAELKRKLKTDSKNSSLPPSSDKFKEKDKKLGRKKRKKGGQKGHKGSQRALAPPEAVSAVHDIIPEHCAHCSAQLPDDGDMHGDPERHQQWELPDAPPLITEFRLHTQSCPHCQGLTKACLPADVSASAFGPRVHALVATLTGACRMSKRLVVNVMQSIHGIPMSLGAVSQIEKRVSEALEDSYGEAHVHVKNAAIAHADETGWRHAGVRHWVWALLTGTVAVFMIHPNRNAQAAYKLLGSFMGVLVTDRCPSYNNYNDNRQFCWAHLLRDFAGLAAYSGKEGKTGEKLLHASWDLFHQYHRWKDGKIQRQTFDRYALRIKDQMKVHLETGMTYTNASYTGKCSYLNNHWELAWTFLSDENIPLTNNAAEQAVRHMVIWRKVSYGNHSDIGCRYSERVMSAVVSCRFQDRDIYVFLKDACTAFFAGKKGPTLVPTP